MSLLNVNSSNTRGSNLFFFVSTFYDYFSFRQLREKGLNIIDMYCKNEYKIC